MTAHDEAVQAVAEALIAPFRGSWWMWPVGRVAEAAVAAAAPILLAAERQRIAEAIRAEGPWCSGGREPHGGCLCYEVAARIAEAGP